MADELRLRQDLKVLLVKKLRLHGVEPASIGDDELLVRGPLGLDSIDMLELALAVEDAYGVKITDEELARKAFRTLAELARFVLASRQASQDPQPTLE